MEISNKEEIRILESNLNPEIKVISISTPVLNDLSLLDGKGIIFNPNARQDAISKAKIEMDEFFCGAFNRILQLQKKAAELEKKTKNERELHIAELVSNHKRKLRRSSF